MTTGARPRPGGAPLTGERPRRVGPPPQPAPGEQDPPHRRRPTRHRSRSAPGARRRRGSAWGQPEPDLARSGVDGDHLPVAEDLGGPPGADHGGDPQLAADDGGMAGAAAGCPAACRRGPRRPSRARPPPAPRRRRAREPTRQPHPSARSAPSRPGSPLAPDPVDDVVVHALEGDDQGAAVTVVGSSTPGLIRVPAGRERGRLSCPCGPRPAPEPRAGTLVPTRAGRDVRPFRPVAAGPMLAQWRSIATGSRCWIARSACSCCGG